METPLLQTKLYIPPVRPELVSRPRLIERLDAGLHRKLTLLSAPAGFGKTTLLSEWVKQSKDRAAWLSLDKEDNDEARFWSYLIAALQTVQPDLGQDALRLLQTPQQPAAQAILTALLNQVAALPQVVVLVLDDYHLISDPAIHEGLAFLLEHLPPQMHVVISTRADPPLPIFRLRAHGQLTELRSDDLRFTPDEAATFLNTVMGLDLTSEDGEALETRTEGWIVGLQLAALSLQDRADAQYVQLSARGVRDVRCDPQARLARRLLDAGHGKWLCRDDRGGVRGPVDVIGTSTGGSIAQHFAADHPALVRRLVLHASAYTLGGTAKEAQMRVGHLARQRKWREASAVLLGFMMSPSRFGKITAAIGSRLMASTATDDPSDLIVTAEAEDKHDFKDRLAEIRAPTLVIAGARDPFYGETLLRETADGIPNARLILYPGKGHTLAGKQFELDVLGFLRDDVPETFNTGRENLPCRNNEMIGRD